MVEPAIKYRQEDPYLLTADEEQVMNRKLQIFNEVIQEFPVELGKEVSKKERDLNVMTESTLTYGEIEFISFAEVFATINARYGGLPEQGVFYDLGSGTGKAVIAAAVLHPFQTCKGIEILEGLYNTSIQMSQVYDDVMQRATQENPDLIRQIPELKFELGSMFDFDWSDATVVFANSTCFNNSMMQQIADGNVRPGTLGITFTKPFPGNKWRIMESIRKNMSWGEATVYMQIRLNDEEVPPQAPVEDQGDLDEDLFQQQRRQANASHISKYVQFLVKNDSIIFLIPVNAIGYTKILKQDKIT